MTRRISRIETEALWTSIRNATKSNRNVTQHFAEHCEPTLILRVVGNSEKVRSRRETSEGMTEA